MGRYFFNVYDGFQLIDDTGTELPDLQSVREEAVKTAGALLREGGHVDLWSGEEWKMVVVDEKGLEVLTLRFSASQPGR